jgi:DNA-binding LytR/AlgR family response regulator
MKMKCLIVEDEPIAREILKSYVQKVDFLDVVEELPNAVAAFNFLQKNTVQLLFLDIKMPQMSGIDLLKAIQQKPKVIVTSAYRYYATDAFELDVIDYLLKPYPFERFLKALTRVRADQSLSIPSVHSTPLEKAFIFVKGNKQLTKIYIEDIVYIESQRDYLKFKIANQEDVVTRQTIAYYEQLLPANLFLRIHRSFIVSMSKVTMAEASRVFVGSIPLPIGRNYKQSVQEFLLGVAR